jgi:hypothetical protein
MRNQSWWIVIGLFVGAVCVAGKNSKHESKQIRMMKEAMTQTDARTTLSEDPA